MKRSLIVITAVILVICLSGCMGIGIQEKAHEAVTKANASNIATSINAYNNIFPENALADDVSLEDAKAAVGKEGLWPVKMSDNDTAEAWKIIEINNGKATVRE